MKEMECLRKGLEPTLEGAQTAPHALCASCMLCRMKVAPESESRGSFK